MDLDFDDDDLDIDGPKLTYPGEPLTSSQAFMRGHGTYVDNDEVIASVAGTIERVNKLISVRAVRTRYNPEVGDLVVGRITEVQPRRWKVDANSRQDAVLMLSSVNLPGGVQARKVFDAEAVYSNRNDDIDDATRTAISRVSNIIRVLAAQFTPLTDAVLLEAYDWAVEQESDVKDVLQDDFGEALVATISARR
ncbi:Exosome complex component RRP4 [Grifola frondosa]|uniref:Exosome complex component RRP4 n=1 Tax=Grifola frondosa TaxID=5627 RepID=A0A1C7MBD8_GRIFR|nr:Exosome complex component RRP4 [Grifola frondosa]